MGKKHIPEPRPAGQTWCGKCRDFRADAEFYPSLVKRGWGRCRACVNGADKAVLNAARREKYQKDVEAHRARDRKRHARRVADPDARKRYLEKLRRESLRRLFGMTEAEYDARLIAQGGGCAICGVTPDVVQRNLSVDHCHTTGAVRGILCNRCNTGIGLLGDSVDGVARALAYLRATPGARVFSGAAGELGVSTGLVH